MIFTLLLSGFGSAGAQSSKYGIPAVDSLLKISQTSSDLEDSTKIDLFMEIGQELYHSFPDSALNYYQKALDLATLSQLNYRKGQALNGIGKSHYVRADYHQSLDAYQQSLKLFEKLNDIPGIIRGLNGTGIVFNMIGQSEKAISNHKKSILLCSASGDQKYHVINLFNISIAFNELCQYDSALYYVDSARNGAYQTGDYNTVYKSYNHEAEIFLILERYKEAKTNYEKVIAAKDYNNLWEKQFAIAGMAKVHQYLGNYDQSIQYGHDALEMAKTMNAKWDLKEVTKTLSSSYALKNDYKSAYLFHRLFKAYDDTIFNEEKEREINFLLLQEEKLKNDNLLIENKRYEEKISRKDLLIIGFLIIIGLVVLLLMILYYNYRQKTRLNAILREKTKQIEIQNQELANLNSTKDKLFRIIAHDLRTPIGVMMEFTELLHDNLESYNTKTIQKFLSSLKKSSQKSFELLNNLLSWAQAQTDSISFDPQKHKVKPIIETSLAMVHAQAELKNIRFELKIDQKTSVYADNNMLRVILRNLLSNAIKFSHKGGDVVISVTESNSGTIFCIKDSGIGICQETQVSIFSTATLQSRPGTQNEKGTGIGLILCKEFVDKHKGKIWVESQKDKGSMFCFMFPEIQA